MFQAEGTIKLSSAKTGACLVSLGTAVKPKWLKEGERESHMKSDRRAL